MKKTAQELHMERESKMKAKTEGKLESKAVIQRESSEVALLYHIREGGKNFSHWRPERKKMVTMDKENVNLKLSRHKPWRTLKTLKKPNLWSTGI